MTDTMYTVTQFIVAAQEHVDRSHTCGDANVAEFHWKVAQTALDRARSLINEL